MKIKLYIDLQASGFGQYLLEQFLFVFVGWVPTIMSIALRGLFYRLILHINGWAAIEVGVRLRFANNICLANGVYLDKGVYLHACPDGISVGENRLVVSPPD
jgi:hypothetical protein